MALDEESVGNLKKQLEKLFAASLRVTVPDEPDVEPIITVCDKESGDYQCNNAMKLWPRLQRKATEFTGRQSVAQALKNNLPTSEMVESCSVEQGGFVNIILSKQWVAKSIHKMLMDGIGTWAPKLSVKRAVVDFSSPNIAKEMHVGHLRSTIIGDTIARMLEFSNVEVLRRNHVGDWGTQFGMLIEFLFETFPDWENSNDQAIGDLEAFYKASKKRFDSDSDFKERAQQAVVKLQGGEKKYRKAWQQICEISRKGFEKVYERLGVRLEEKGESFYNPYIPMVLELLNEKGLVEESEGAHVIFIEGKKAPLIVIKRDGGFNYASTDLAALWYRLNEEKAEWIIYLTDASQREHFDMVFTAAKRAGWLSAQGNKYPRADHIHFGLVKGEDGKRMRTRSTEVVPLINLLDKAKSGCKDALILRGQDREWTEEELMQLEPNAEAIGYAAVKYADLKNNRETSYIYQEKQMLNDKGDTAVYLLYAYARICSIIKKSGTEINELKKVGSIEFTKDAECVLGLHLLRFAEAIEEACTNLYPNVLCKYLYGLSLAFTGFYSGCQVVGTAEESSRLLLCEATRVVMEQCFHILGITPLERI
ncbi:Arginine--tRNA ligase [Heracleum sosnowskyi]|uniref:arginine--tRNA ligase n=1 Tax=Heracleum sosnowskyi TaxID=360622 RepID=A0AAD8I429_9APIA|nr:Arginine--tRNA ligase [Heracleum sosnowskyi]